MNEFTFDTSRNKEISLKGLKEEYIIITSVSAENIDLLSNQQFELITSYPDGRKYFQLMHTGAYITPYTKGTTVDVRFPIEDCENTVIRVVRSDNSSKYTFGYVTLKEILEEQDKVVEDESKIISTRVIAWQNALHQLNDKIETWTKELVKVDVKKHEISIIEERTGEYKAEQLELFLPNNIQILFEPMGTFLIGASGRVNILSNVRFFSNFILVLQETKGIDVWYLIQNRNRAEKREFTKSQLFRVIEDAISKK